MHPWRRRRRARAWCRGDGTDEQGRCGAPPNGPLRYQQGVGTKLASGAEVQARRSPRQEARSVGDGRRRRREKIRRMENEGDRRRQRRTDGGWLFVLSTANIDCQSISEWSLSPGFSYRRNPRQRLRFVEATSAAFHNPKSLPPVSSPTVCFFLRTPRSSDRFTSLLRRAPSAVPGVSTRQLLLLTILGAPPSAAGLCCADAVRGFGRRICTVLAADMQEH